MEPICWRSVGGDCALSGHVEGLLLEHMVHRAALDWNFHLWDPCVSKATTLDQLQRGVDSHSPTRTQNVPRDMLHAYVP